MSNTKQIYLHGEGLQEAQFIEITPESNISDIILEFERISGIPAGKDPIMCFMEDSETALELSSSAEANKIENRAHLHCHRCKKVKVNVQYNGKEETFSLSPSVKIEKVFKKSLKAFDIDPKDAANLVLRSGGVEGQILQDDDHIGSFAHHPGCSLELYLTPKKQVQG